MSRAQTKMVDNSYLADKIAIRLNNLPASNEINVLNCYAGDNLIWSAIQDLSNKVINVTNIDIKVNNNFFCLKGDNLKYITSVNLNNYDVIDLDAYGVPYQQLEAIFKAAYKGIIFITYIQSNMGMLPHKLLYDFGYTKSMVKRCPTLFVRRGVDILFNYLYKNGVKNIKYKIADKKLYGVFTTSCQ